MFHPPDFRAGNQVGSTTAQEDLRNTTVDFSRGLSIRVTLCVSIFAKMEEREDRAALVASSISAPISPTFAQAIIAGVRR